MIGGRSNMVAEKFAIIGTSSAGKTTLCYHILYELKKLGVYVDGVLQQDRRMVFPRDVLENAVEAQYWVISNMMAKENEMALRDGTDYLVSDRSVLDFYAYYEYQYGRSEEFFNFIIWYTKNNYIIIAKLVDQEK